MKENLPKVRLYVLEKEVERKEGRVKKGQVAECPKVARP